MNAEKAQYSNIQHDMGKPNESVLLQQQWAGRSLQDITQPEIPAVNAEYSVSKARTDYRSSMPNIQQESTPVANHYHRVPPPIPPNKPSTHYREPAVVSKYVRVIYTGANLMKNESFVYFF